VRYAKFEQNFGAMLADDESILGQLAWLRRFEGFGVTVGAEFRRPLGNSGLNAFARGQGALLFGSKDLQRVDYAALPPVVRLDDADEVVGIGEMEIGLEWSRRLALGDVFVRGTYGGQLWTEAGAPTLTFLGFEGFGLSLGLAR
ncbi:MAG: hypothetical protein GX621_06600, partial [Pirellulaceae bacterium]|nr:hypothetical protein [Pirellulaceae bacterium]